MVVHPPDVCLSCLYHLCECTTGCPLVRMLDHELFELKYMNSKEENHLKVSEHLLTAEHHFDPDEFKMLSREPKDFARKILEAIHIRKETPVFDRDKGLDLDSVLDSVLINQLH